MEKYGKEKEIEVRMRGGKTGWNKEMRYEQRDENRGVKEEGKIKNYGRLKINYHKRPCLQVATSLFSAHDSQKYFGKYFA